MVPCTLCKAKIGRSGTETRRHWVQAHPERAKEVCPFCAEKYFSDTSLRTHLTSCHARRKLHTNQTAYWRWIGKLKPEDGFKDEEHIASLRRIAALPAHHRHDEPEYPCMPGERKRVRDSSVKEEEEGEAKETEVAPQPSSSGTRTRYEQKVEFLGDMMCTSSVVIVKINK